MGAIILHYYWKTKKWIQKEAVQGIKENTVSIFGTIFEPHVSYLRKDIIKMYKLLGRAKNRVCDKEHIFSEINRVSHIIAYSEEYHFEYEEWQENYDKFSEDEIKLNDHYLRFLEHSYFLMHNPNFEGRHCHNGVDLSFLRFVVEIELNVLEKKGNTNFEESMRYEREPTKKEKEEFMKLNLDDIWAAEKKDRREWYDNFDLNKVWEERKGW